MSNISELALTEEFFLLMQPFNATESEPTLISTSIDMAEFEFTEAELQKLTRLTRRLELALLAEFSKYFEAASVVVEIRPK